MVLDESDGRQLLAELLQHDHALQQGHVVHTATEGRSAVRLAAPSTGRQGGEAERRT